MKLFRWLRKPKHEQQTPANTATLPGVNGNSDHIGNVIAMATTTPAVFTARSEVATHPLTTLIEPMDALLRFARDYLVASGAKVRMEEDDLLTAVKSDGHAVRYTTSLLRARNEVETELLVQGGASLAELLDDCASQSRAVALHLWESGDPLALARAAFGILVAGCANCLSTSKEDQPENPLPFCEQCPLRTGQTLLAGFGPITRAQEVRRWESQSAELTFHIISTDRRGRHDEWKRIAFDLTSGREIPQLPLDSVLRMETAATPQLTIAEIEETIRQGQTLIAPAARALAAFLRLRSEEDYQRRCDDIQITHDRLLREGAEAAEVIQEVLQRELAHLAETYAVAVDVQLESLALISSPMAEVAILDKKGHKLTVQVDIGRAYTLPCTCDACSTTLHAGKRCPEGHLACTNCLKLSQQEQQDCPICAKIAVPHPSVVQPVPKSGKLSQTTALHIDQLDVMTTETWQMCVAWLLERQGYHSERMEPGEDNLRFFGEHDEQPFAAVALRLPKDMPLGAIEVQQAAALGAATQQNKRVLLLATAPASQAAQTTADRLGITLLDRTRLRLLLEQLEAAHVLEVAAEEQAALARATQAETTRTRIVAELDMLEDALTRASNTRKAGSRTATVAATETIISAQTTAIQAFVAWETLTADWLAAFGEREARDGSLAILSDPEALIALAERAAHLGNVTQQAFIELQDTPGVGELGYTAWRKAVIEELMARCEALRWRIGAVIPAHWHDFTQAHDESALQEAENSTAAASYAHARAEKALVQLQTRARIAIPG